jgi:predicted metal-dependent enzyme (double-stranded beta helix superfamily)
LGVRHEPAQDLAAYVDVRVRRAVLLLPVDRNVPVHQAARVRKLMFAVPVNTVAAQEKSALRHPARVAVAYAASRDRWRHLLHYDADERYAVLIDRTDTDEIWLMSWLPGQGAPRHDHGDTSGAFTVVHGELTEVVLRRNAVQDAPPEINVLRSGQTRAFGPGYAHQVSNKGVDPAVSIHVYRYGGRTIRPYPADAAAARADGAAG